MAYFLLLLFGLFLGTFFPIEFYVLHASLFSVICFILGPLLILWAQYTTRRVEKLRKEQGGSHLNLGPYRYLRNPTQLGLVILVAGYAFASGTAILFVTAGIAYIISNVFFRKYESILESKYGQDYLAYKSSVPKIM